MWVLLGGAGGHCHLSWPLPIVSACLPRAPPESLPLLFLLRTLVTVKSQPVPRTRAESGSPRPTCLLSCQNVMWFGESGGHDTASPVCLPHPTPPLLPCLKGTCPAPRVSQVLPQLESLQHGAPRATPAFPGGIGAGGSAGDSEPGWTPRSGPVLSILSPPCSEYPTWPSSPSGPGSASGGPRGPGTEGAGALAGEEVGNTWMN